MAKVIETSAPEKLKVLEVGKVYDIAGITEYAKTIGKAVEMQKFLEQAEKVVGKDGRMVMLVGEEGKEFPCVLVRFKDGKALIASFPK
jgi:hypothetical protein